MEEDLCIVEMIINNIYLMEIENLEFYKFLMYGNCFFWNVLNIKGEINGVLLFEFMFNLVYISLNILFYMKIFGLNFNDFILEDFEKYKVL